VFASIVGPLEKDCAMIDGEDGAPKTLGAPVATAREGRKRRGRCGADEEGGGTTRPTPRAWPRRRRWKVGGGVARHPQTWPWCRRGRVEAVWPAAVATVAAPTKSGSVTSGVVGWQAREGRRCGTAVQRSEDGEGREVARCDGRSPKERVRKFLEGEPLTCGPQRRAVRR
jgi:hypothetical protein